MSRPTVERGAPESPGRCGGSVQRLVPQVYSLLELLRIARPRWVRRNTPSIRQCRYARLLENLESHFVGRTQADPGLCCKGLSGNAFHRECRRMEAVPD